MSRLRRALCLVAYFSAAVSGADPAFQTVRIPSTVDGAYQAALWWPGPAGGTVPLLVALHTWSGDYRQRESAEYLRRAAARGWAVIHPDFRGPNVRPEACGSDAAVSDIMDAVAFARRSARIDEHRIYLAGVSGGGYMSLLMAARHPEVWAAVTSWAPITDLAAWHAECSARGLKYAGDMEAVFGGSPPRGGEYARRSPLGQLGRAKGLPIDINEGIHDGHTGSVPISHALRAFNELAAANGYLREAVPDSLIAQMVRSEKAPTGSGERDPAYSRAVLFRRTAGPARVTIFEGGHEILYDSAFAWLAGHRRR